MLDGGQVRIRWSDLTTVKEAILRAAADGVAGLRPRFDIFDEAEGAWAPKTAGLIFLARGQGLLAKAQTVTKPFRLELYRALARPSGRTATSSPMSSPTGTHSTRHNARAGASSQGQLKRSRGNTYTPSRKKRARSLRADTPSPRARPGSDMQGGSSSREDQQSGVVANAVAASRATRVTTTSDSNVAYACGDSVANAIVLSDDDDKFDDDILPNPLAFLWE